MQSSVAKNAIEELLRVRAHERDAHFANDVDGLMLNQSDSFTAVVGGNIHHLTGDQMRRNFVQAFENATYHEFDDLEEPEVHVSNDGRLAWVASRIMVRKSQIDDTGKARERRFVSTSITTYEKQGRWLRTATSGNVVEQDLA